MLFRQLIHEDLGCASYLIGDPASGAAAVVDPQWNVDPYLHLSRLHGVRIEHVFETHNHADHVSGHGRLARASGATIHVSELAEAEYEHEPLGDGDVLELGEAVTIEAVHTPGHRPEHTSFLLRDAGRGGHPVAVLSGDSLFVGDVARPDLAVEPREGAAGIFRSLHERLLTLPDEVEVWPAHLGGSLCGSSGIDLKTSSTIGFERAHNRALAFEDEAAFVEESVSTLGEKPPNVEHIVALNRGPLIESIGSPARLTRAASRRRSPLAPSPSTAAPTSSSTRPTSRARSAPPPTTPASAPRSRRSSPPRPRWSWSPPQTATSSTPPSCWRPSACGCAASSAAG